MKTLVIDALIGAGIHSVILAQECERVGLAAYDKRTQTWAWRREQLERIDLEKLQELYTAMREAREEATPTDPEEEKPLIILQ
jgi:hypothetical protein